MATFSHSLILHQTLIKIDVKTFPTVNLLLEIFMALPITNCSSLKFLKNYLGISMGESRLNELAFLFIHCNIEVNLEDVLEILSRKKLRLASA